MQKQSALNESSIIELIISVIGIISIGALCVVWIFSTFQTKQDGTIQNERIEKRLERIENKIDQIQSDNFRKAD